MKKKKITKYPNPIRVDWSDLVKTIKDMEKDIPTTQPFNTLNASDNVGKKFPNDEIKLDMNSWFYKNCKRQRKVGAKICQCCPFREFIEKKETE